ncbi:hypothetical protein [Motilibacter deserti]|uniref:Uncharacterized protein n=1 Tax=Motilibacter deserti TaxID=2714956 RepID=A0ABX0GQ85_9ACTN|nr:hypothetical protein [Motilibacter deserti]NHC12987.1 hypothetical protein [Motilibacter deserti]
MHVPLRLGEKVVVGGRVATVTPTALAWLPRARAHLVEVALAGETLTYGELREELGLPYLVQGMGRFLDLLSEDCRRRGEPSLASLVVNASTGEVGGAFAGDGASERALVHARRTWS